MEIRDNIEIIGIGFDGLELSKGITKNTKQEIRIIDEVLWNSKNFDYLYVPKKIVIALKEINK